MFFRNAPEAVILEPELLELPAELAVMTLEGGAALGGGFSLIEAEATPPPPPLPMAFKDKAEDLRQRIMIKMAATVNTMPPITADNMMIKGSDSEKKRRTAKNDKPKKGRKRKSGSQGPTCHLLQNDLKSRLLDQPYKIVPFDFIPC